MKATQLLLGSLLSLPLLASSDALAQGYEDLDGGGEESSSKSKNKKDDRARPEVREIVKGTYAKANVGGALFLGTFSGYVNPGTSLGLAFGSDFVDQESSSMAWELMFFQGIHNGTHYDIQADVGCGIAPCVQGDLRTYTFAAALEYSIYPNRRFGIGLRAGAGLMLSPLLMEEDYYLEEVVGKSWDGYNPSFHFDPHPVVLGGPTFEYYTKLSHFSVGADVDAFYAIGFDLGVSITGTLKYTF